VYNHIENDEAHNGGLIKKTLYESIPAYHYYCAHCKRWWSPSGSQPDTHAEEIFVYFEEDEKMYDDEKKTKMCKG